MYHPLIDNPKKLKDNDLEEKIFELTKKYHISLRLGQGAVSSQILTVLEMYKEEQHRRYLETSKNGLKKENDDLNDLINVD
jgi:coenzyme F420-reducing hydrogenase gamma subunit